VWRCILLDIYWNILTMHGPINVKSPNNTSKWRMGFNSAFKRLNPNVTTIMSGHGNIRSYLHRLKIIDSTECPWQSIDSTECPCKTYIQAIDHLIYQCETLKYEREILKNSVLKTGNWPISKSELVNKNLKQLIRYINSMDLEKLNHSKSCK
jgi:hypothetical protein